jgi:DNA invertase Pin-like site-specific DNA recombinase
MTGQLLGYARVSTELQNPDLQTDALAAAGCAKVFTDYASGAAANRPQLTALLDYARDGDTLVVWRLDRLGRSMQHLVATMSQLDQRGVGFKSITEGMDTTTSGGVLVFHVFAAVAQFERDLIRERTNAGLRAARTRGRVGGRPPRLDPDKRHLVDTMIAEHRTITDTANALGVSRTTIYRHLASR